MITKPHISFYGKVKGIPVYLEIPKNELINYYYYHVDGYQQNNLTPLSLLRYTKKFVNHMIIQGLKDHNKRIHHAK